jgi:hypothetical protein
VFSLPKWGPHAEKAKNIHNITEQEIADTWVYGELESTRDGCWRLVGEEVTLVLSRAGTFIITLYPNKHKDTNKSERATNARSIGATRFEN